MKRKEIFELLDDESEFGFRLKEIRKRFGHDTAESFAKRMGLRGFTYRKYERGESFPDLSFLKKLCSMGIDLNYLIAGKNANLQNEGETIEKSRAEIDVARLKTLTRTEYKNRVLGPCPRDLEIALDQPFVAVASDGQNKFYVSIHELEDVLDIEPTASSFHTALEKAKSIAAKRGFELLVIEDDIEGGSSKRV